MPQLSNSTDKGRHKKSLESALDQEDPLEREWLPTPVFLPGESHGQRSLEGCSPLAAESDTTKQLTHFSVVTSGHYCFYLLGCFSISKKKSKEEEKNPCGQSRGAVDGSLLSPEHQTDRHTVIPLGVALNRGFKHHS